MNEITKSENKNQGLQVSKEQQVLMPIAESYIKLFPHKDSENTRQNIISMALKLSEIKDKTGRPAIEVCSQESVMQVAQEVIVKKLDLMKNQAALIVRGNKLMLQSQYQGNVARALALNPFLSHFNFVPIYTNDKVDIEIGKDGSYNIKNHTTSFANIGNNNIVGGYVRAVKKDGSVYMTEVMTMEQIKIAWSKSSNSSLSVHKEFPLKMVRKTILNSLCSWLINTTGEQEEYGEVEYIENEKSPIVNGMEINLEENQGFEVLDEAPIEPEYFQTHSYDEPTEEENEIVDEEPTDEEWLMAMEEDNAEQTIPYSKWLNEYKGNGWEQIKGSYDTKARTVRVRRV